MEGMDRMIAPRVWEMRVRHGRAKWRTTVHISRAVRACEVGYKEAEMTVAPLIMVLLWLSRHM